MVAILLAIAAAASIHFFRAYERSIVQRPTATVTIPEGSTRYDIDRILSNADVLERGEFIAAASTSLEGKLFPDTYEFYIETTPTSVIQKLLGNFDVKTESLFTADPQNAMNTKNAEQDLIIASMVQKEVASSIDMALVAGILEKRLASGTFLNVDATICYAKQIAHPTSTAGCYPITARDLKMDSPYNTYIYKGLPPTPIGNPGVEAIEATLHPQTSTYWYYLSDPKTGQTIYAQTLAQQVANQKKYLQ